eukprot:scaffold74464_cov40-Prasinocladus_malaysianus.AAC.1
MATEVLCPGIRSQHSSVESSRREKPWVQRLKLCMMCAPCESAYTEMQTITPIAQRKETPRKSCRQSATCHS